jgi:hypothetical protein
MELTFIVNGDGTLGSCPSRPSQGAVALTAWRCLFAEGSVVLRKIIFSYCTGRGRKPKSLRQAMPIAPALRDKFDYEQNKSRD